jgi:hypothetical protein
VSLDEAAAQVPAPLGSSGSSGARRSLQTLAVPAPLAARRQSAVQTVACYAAEEPAAASQPAIAQLLPVVQSQVSVQQRAVAEPAAVQPRLAAQSGVTVQARATVKPRASARTPAPLTRSSTLARAASEWSASVPRACGGQLHSQLPSSPASPPHPQARTRSHRR